MYSIFRIHMIEGEHMALLSAVIDKADQSFVDETDITCEDHKSKQVTYVMTDEFGHPLYGYPVD